MKFQAALLILLTTFLAPSLSTADYVDAFGDAQDSFGAGVPLHDIDTLSVEYDSSNLYFDLTFHNPISAPSTGNADSLIGVIEFDTDQLVTTGLPAIQNGFSPPFATLNGVGVDFFLLLDDSVTPGEGALFDSFQNFQASVTLNYGPSSVSGQIQLSDLGNDDGLVNFTTIIGTPDQPTDASDSVGTSTAIPEPGSGLFLLAGLGIGLIRRSSR